MTEFPQYFAFGDKYRAPSPYYRAEDATHSVLVIPGPRDDQELRIDRGLEFFLEEAERGQMTAITLKKIKAELSRWYWRTGPPVM